jgi:hypothetical protein
LYANCQQPTANLQNNEAIPFGSWALEVGR